MPPVVAASSKLAVVKASTWLTAGSLGASTRIPYVSCDIDGEPGTLQNDLLVDTAERNDPDQVETKAEGDLVLYDDYRQALLLWSQFFGVGGTPTEVEAAARYKHVFAWQASTDGKFFTLGHAKNLGSSKALRIAGVKASKLRVSGAAGGRVQASFTCLGAGVVRTVDPSSWTYAYDPVGGGARHVLHKHGVLRINAASGGALGSSDKVNYFRGFEYDLDRSLDLDFQQDGTAIEPVPGGFAELKVRIDFFGCDGTLYDLLRDAQEAKTALKFDHIFTGPALGAGNYLQSFYAPRFILTDAKLPVSGPGRVPFSINGTLHKASAVPTGFPTGYDEALTVEFTNEISTDPLA